MEDFITGLRKSNAIKTKLFNKLKTGSRCRKEILNADMINKKMTKENINEQGTGTGQEQLDYMPASTAATHLT